VLDPFSVVEEEDELPPEFETSVRTLSAATFWAFVASALLAQAGLFAASLGLLLIVFRGQWTLGGGLLVGGVLALAITAAIYVWHEHQR
jgi:hypothetical protein